MSLSHRLTSRRQKAAIALEQRVQRLQRVSYNSLCETITNLPRKTQHCNLSSSTSPLISHKAKKEGVPVLPPALYSRDMSFRLFYLFLKYDFLCDYLVVSYRRNFSPHCHFQLFTRINRGTVKKLGKRNSIKILHDLDMSYFQAPCGCATIFL